MARALTVAVSAALLSAASASPLPFFFGGAKSQTAVSETETVLFSHTLNATSALGAITHWWITGGSAIDSCTIRVYVDGETTASLAFTPSLAAGVGFNDPTASWSNALYSKQSTMSSWSSKVRIPFGSSITITLQGPAGSNGQALYYIFRGIENPPPIAVGGIVLPETARLTLQTQQVTLNPLDYLTVLDVPRGKAGAVLMHTLAFSAPNLNTLEGCVRAYQGGEGYPGTLLATGTEDFFDSSYYFAAGRFTGLNTGLTHISAVTTPVELSAYRIFLEDVLPFTDGIQMIWRNGDTTDPATGLKCTLQSGGRTVGSPGVANVTTLTWAYVYDA